MEKKDIKYKVLRLLNLIMLIIFIIVIIFYDSELDKYHKIFWIAPVLTAVLLIIDDMIKDIENKNKTLVKLEHLIFFIQWILLSSMLIITLFLDFSIISKITSLTCILALTYAAYKRYMGKNEEEFERKE